MPAGPLQPRTPGLPSEQSLPTRTLRPWPRPGRGLALFSRRRPSTSPSAMTPPRHRRCLPARAPCARLPRRARLAVQRRAAALAAVSDGVGGGSAGAPRRRRRAGATAPRAAGAPEGRSKAPFAEGGARRARPRGHQAAAALRAPAAPGALGEMRRCDASPRPKRRRAPRRHALRTGTPRERVRLELRSGSPRRSTASVAKSAALGAGSSRRAPRSTQHEIAGCAFAGSSAPSDAAQVGGAARSGRRLAPRAPCCFAIFWICVLGIGRATRQPPCAVRSAIPRGAAAAAISACRLASDLVSAFLPPPRARGGRAPLWRGRWPPPRARAARAAALAVGGARLLHRQLVLALLLQAPHVVLRLGHALKPCGPSPAAHARGSPRGTRRRSPPFRQRAF